VIRGIHLDWNYTCHVSGDPPTLRDIRARKMTQIKMSGSSPHRPACLKTLGTLLVMSNSFYLEMFGSVRLFRHDLKVRENVTRALETPPNGKSVMLESK
jgi:hypothetical protein